MQRFIVGSVMFLLVTLGWGDRGLTEQAPAPRGELRVVDKHPWNWSWIVLNVFEHLIELDKNGKPVSRLATAWRWVNDRTLEMPLRRGVKFQNGEAFDAEIVKLNWEENTRLRQPLAIGSFMNFKPGSRLEVIDSYTIRFVFPEPDGGALAKLRAVHIANRQFYREFGWGEKSW
jgi:ABC-type transport system substrate-binding protein